jgi:hypothetical protein
VTRLRCDDGREGTVEEMIWVKAAPHRATTRSSSQHVRGDSPPWPVVVFRAMSIESPSAGLRPGQSGQSPGRCGRWATRRPTASSASKSPSSPFSPFRCGAPYEAHDPSGGLTGSFSGV